MSHDPYLALRNSAFRRYLTGHVLAVLGQGMLMVAVGWELYERTRSTLILGLVGLVQVIPLALLILPAGHVSDNYDRRRVLMAAEATIGIAAVGLLIASMTTAPLWVYYLLLAGYGAGRTFQLPAKQSLLPNIVPMTSFENAVAWNSGGWQGADVIGPALGGLIIARTGGAAAVYGFTAAAAFVFALLLVGVRTVGTPRAPRRLSWHGLLEGARFVRGSPILLAAMSLDLFAVLLGGVVALLPVFAKDILHVGPVGLGWLRAAQSFGAVSMSVMLAHRPPLERAGRSLLISVVTFGTAIVIFGLSRTFALSLAALVLAGAADAVSVVIRLALAQLETPDELRGRVSAVNGLFIGMSNELGEFESGFLASLIGPVGAVVAGGVAVAGVVGIVATVWPEIRTLGRLGSRLA
ncbi:MAG: MFS transporter [Gemmatimonadales bacterium]